MIESKFNLIEEKWIPVAEKGKVSLKDIFSDESITALGGNSVEKIAVFKLLLAIGQSAFTPNNEDEWKNCGLSNFRDKVLKYFDSQHDNFYLYGEKPFLQMVEIVKAERKSYGNVQMGVATNNTTVVTQIQCEKELDDSERALLLIVLMGFALGGKKTDNSVVLSSGYTLKSKTAKPGPCILSIGALHSFVFCGSILNSIFLNLFTSEKLVGLNYSEGMGTAPWEKMVKGEDDDTAKQLKNSYMGRLVPLCRFVLFSDKDFHYSEGLLHKSYLDGVVDPSVTVNFSAKPKPKILWVDPEKRPWRQLSSIISFFNSSSVDFECQQIKNCSSRIKKNTIFTIWSGGVKVSSNAGEQYLTGQDDFVVSEVQLLSDCFNSSLFDNLTLEMQKLDDLSKSLYGSVFKYYKNMMLDGSKISSKATNIFWQLCESQFQNLIDICSDYSDLEIEKLRKKFGSYLLQVYDETCANQTARQLETWAEFRPKLIKESKNTKKKDDCKLQIELNLFKEAEV